MGGGGMDEEAMMEQMFMQQMMGGMGMGGPMGGMGGPMGGMGGMGGPMAGMPEGGDGMEDLMAAMMGGMGGAPGGGLGGMPPELMAAMMGGLGGTPGDLSGGAPPRGGKKEKKGKKKGGAPREAAMPTKADGDVDVEKYLGNDDDDYDDYNPFLQAMQAAGMGSDGPVVGLSMQRRSQNLGRVVGRGLGNSFVSGQRVRRAKNTKTSTDSSYSYEDYDSEDEFFDDSESETAAAPQKSGVEEINSDQEMPPLDDEGKKKTSVAKSKKSMGDVLDEVD